MTVDSSRTAEFGFCRATARPHTQGPQGPMRAGAAPSAISSPASAEGAGQHTRALDRLLLWVSHGSLKVAGSGCVPQMQDGARRLDIILV